MNKICRYKIIFDNGRFLQAGPHDLIELTAVRLKNVELIITGNTRINACDYEERTIKEGESMSIKYPKHGYVALRATGDDAHFKLSYKFIDQDPEMFEVKVGLEAFMKTKTFIIIIVVISIILVILVILIAVVCSCRH